jgi:hypothetical protein
MLPTLSVPPVQIQAAVDREDYEEAKQLKGDIDRLRAAGELAAVGPTGREQQAYSQPLPQAARHMAGDDEPVSLPLDAPERGFGVPSSTTAGPSPQVHAIDDLASGVQHQSILRLLAQRLSVLASTLTRNDCIAAPVNEQLSVLGASSQATFAVPRDMTLA